jgi:type I restriction-modification system DNA methylase subunit
MAIKKSKLYSSIRASCDKLRGGMDASQYKDHMLWVYHCPKREQNYRVNVDKNRKIPIVRYLTDVLQDGLEKHS